MAEHTAGSRPASAASDLVPGDSMADAVSASVVSFLEFAVERYHVDLAAATVRHEVIPCTDLEDALGGIARAFKFLDACYVEDPFDPSATVIMNLGLLSGTRVMTGLRTFFSGYSPLKASRSGTPGLMWSAGSGEFGARLRGLGIDDVVFRGRGPRPTLVRISRPDGTANARFEFLDGAELLGLSVNDKIQMLHRRFPGAHFAVVGPAAEHYREVAYAGIALSTSNQLTTGDAKPRYCGRGGFGGILAAKNLVAIAADGIELRGQAQGLKEVNRKINLGSGSLRYRDVTGSPGGGTWRNAQVLQEVQALPEFNFRPSGTDASVALLRPSVESGPYLVRAESCHLCGIRCHKNVYRLDEPGQAGSFRTKVDYEPLALLSANLGIFDPEQAFELIALVDELGMDAISLGVTLGYAMEWNRRHPTAPIADGLSYGDFAATREAVLAVGEGCLPRLGQGVKRLSEQTGETGYAMHSKGVEYPAYLPQTNPGFAWSLAGGHMSMRTFFLLLLERETGLDYWVDAITNRGPLILLDDITGICKFAAIDQETEAEAIRIAAGLDVSADDLREVVRRTFVRGYANERRHGFAPEDYSLPAEAHDELPHLRLPYFNTSQFFTELRERVLAVLDERARAYGWLP
jgi:aldehyde:ferredoxin oxidoreductase